MNNFETDYYIKKIFVGLERSLERPREATTLDRKSSINIWGAFVGIFRIYFGGLRNRYWIPLVFKGHFMRRSRKPARREPGGPSNDAELHAWAFYGHVIVHPLYLSLFSLSNSSSVDQCSECVVQVLYERHHPVGGGHTKNSYLDIDY